MFKAVPKTPKEKKRCWFVILAALLLTFPLVFATNRMIHHVHGRSMLPTIISNCTLVVPWPWGVPDKQDIVVVEHAGEKRWVKRVVGIPGDQIQIRPGREPILVNGVSLIEPYLDPDYVKYEHTINITLGPDEYYVLGDNRQNSFDSRFVGPILSSEIIATFDFWFSFMPGDVMSYLVSFLFSLCIFLPCAFFLGGLMDLTWDFMVMKKPLWRKKGC
jgi:signal peptidase I